MSRSGYGLANILLRKLAEPHLADPTHPVAVTVADDHILKAILVQIHDQQISDPGIPLCRSADRALGE